MKEVSEILKVTERTLYNYIKGGKFKAKKIGGKWMITEENLRQFINAE
jgi:excisionase family DNA binding protein